jgi:hypothetical protein
MSFIASAIRNNEELTVAGPVHGPIFDAFWFSPAWWLRPRTGAACAFEGSVLRAERLAKKGTLTGWSDCGVLYPSRHDGTLVWWLQQQRPITRIGYAPENRRTDSESWNRPAHDHREPARRRWSFLLKCSAPWSRRNPSCSYSRHLRDSCGSHAGRTLTERRKERSELMTLTRSLLWKLGHSVAITRWA